MGIVDYSDSDSSDHGDGNSDSGEGQYSHDPASQADISRAPMAKIRPPPLPSGLRDLYLNGPRLGDEFYEERVRTRAHEEGKWPTHVYIHVDVSPADVELLGHLVHGSWRPLFVSELGVATALHVSLSDTLMLDASDREPFVQMVREAVQEMWPYQTQTHQFADQVTLSNETGTRVFLALPVHDSAIDQLVLRIGAISARFDRALPPDYSPHLSLAWMPVSGDLVQTRLKTPVMLTLGPVKIRIGRAVTSL